MIQIHQTNDMYNGEQFPVIGELAGNSQFRDILHTAHKGKSLYGDCVYKALYTSQAIPHSYVAMGSLYVYNFDLTAKYGFEYNIDNPIHFMEFHSWVVLDGLIIDPALAGAILRGLQMYDAVGCILEGRYPVMLAGTPPNWCRYREVETYAQLQNRTKNC